MHAHIFEFAALVFQLLVLAVVLGVVGFYARKLVHFVQRSRAAKKMEAEAVVAAARARAKKRATQHA